MISEKRKRIVLITPGQPSSNPRLVKEATAFSKAGYEVTVLYCFWADWASRYDHEIKARLPGVEWIEVGGNPASSPNRYAFTRFRHKAYRCLAALFPVSRSLAARAQARAFDELFQAAKCLKADLYIAHNLGALAVAAKAAKVNGSEYSFDAEDFHRGEVRKSTKIYQRIKNLEDAYLPGTAYLTAASPLIADHYAAIYKKPVAVINNVFSISNQLPWKDLPAEPLKLIWFSQTIGMNRGIQDLLEAANEINERKMQITLVGLFKEETESSLRNSLRNSKHSIHFIPPVNETELFALCSDHHIGLASERTEPYNRDICLTNKLFTYLLSGNAILASDTQAQTGFLAENKGIGFLYRTGDIKSLKQVLMRWIDNEHLLTEMRRESFELARSKYNWEIESHRLLEMRKATNLMVQSEFALAAKQS